MKSWANNPSADCPAVSAYTTSETRKGGLSCTAKIARSRSGRGHVRAAAQSEHPADGKDDVGAVERVEVEAVDAFGAERRHLLGSDRRGHQAAFLGCVLQPL